MELTGSFEDLLTQLGQRLETPLDWMTVIADAVVEDLKAQAPVGTTGNLRNSINYKIMSNSIEFGMANYGVFQNYGVMGVNSSRIPVIEPPFGITVDGYAVNGRFAFGTGNYVADPGDPKGWGAYYTGLRAKSWFNMQQLSDGLADATLKALNLE